MTLREVIIGQFKEPHGVLGHVAGWMMARRDSNRARNSWTVGLIDLEHHHRVLEVGCGPGLALYACMATLTTGRAIGLDHSAIMIEQARRRLARGITDGRVELILGGLERLPMHSGPFDRVFSINVVQFLGAIPLAVEALTRAVAANGVLALTYQPRAKKATREDALLMARCIRQAMLDLALVDVRIEELRLRPVPAVCVLGRKGPV
jgi:ubiquinone/menaquinone biosynthesis C-methylase UbiE